MEEMKIYKEDGSEIPSYPMEMTITAEEVRVVGRLRSTVSGLNYSWKSNVRETISSRSPFQPFVDLTFSGEVIIRFLGWHKPPEELIPEQWESWKFLSWGGSLVNAPVQVMAREVKDNTQRPEREALFELCEKAREYHTTASMNKLWAWHLYSEHGVSEEFEKLGRFNFRPIYLGEYCIFSPAGIRWAGSDHKKVIWSWDQITIYPLDQKESPRTLGAKKYWLLKAEPKVK